LLILVQYRQDTFVRRDRSLLDISPSASLSLLKLRRITPNTLHCSIRRTDTNDAVFVSEKLRQCIDRLLYFCPLASWSLRWCSSDFSDLTYKFSKPVFHEELLADVREEEATKTPKPAHVVGRYNDGYIRANNLMYRYNGILPLKQEPLSSLRPITLLLSI